MNISVQPHPTPDYPGQVWLLEPDTKHCLVPDTQHMVLWAYNVIHLWSNAMVAWTYVSASQLMKASSSAAETEEMDRGGGGYQEYQARPPAETVTGSVKQLCTIQFLPTQL